MGTTKIYEVIEMGKLVYGVGINDLYGKTSFVDNSGKRRQLRSYNIWVKMLERCYSKVYQKKYPTYIGCSVDTEWLVFSRFKEWYDDNFLNKEGVCRFELDKDLLGYGSKIYSKNTCIFIPSSVNSFMTNIKLTNTTGFTGVTKRNNTYRARIKDFVTNKRISIGDYSTAKEAGMAYALERAKQAESVKSYMRSLNMYDESVIKLIK